MELLVVLAAMAILAGILLPLLGRSRQLSYRAQCASNLKQLSVAFSLYAGDWSDYLPGPGCLYGDWTYWSQSGSGGINRYVGRKGGVKTIWCCPLQDTWDGKFLGRTYTMNGYLRTPWDVGFPWCKTILCGIRLESIQRPAKTVLLYEGAMEKKVSSVSVDYIKRCANWEYVRGFVDDANDPENGQPWHGKFNNYVYCDGHITARRPGRWTAAELSTGKEMYQWWVDKGKFMQDWNNGVYRNSRWE